MQKLTNVLLVIIATLLVGVILEIDLLIDDREEITCLFSKEILDKVS